MATAHLYTHKIPSRSWFLRVLRFICDAVTLGTSVFFGSGGCSQDSQGQGANQAEVFVTDGVEIPTSEFPFAIRLDLTDALCTGTFVSSTTLITAAHCIHGRSQASFRGTPATKLIHNRRYFDENLVDDIAVVLFPTGTAPAQASLLGRSPRVGEGVTVVGYGHSFYRTPSANSGSGAGTRRKGQNTVAATSRGLVSLTAHPQRNDRAICGSGDSGGPLIVENQLSAVTSARTDAVYPASCLYVDLQSPNSQEFLRRAVQEGADIPIAGLATQTPPQPTSPPQQATPEATPKSPSPKPAPVPPLLGSTPPATPPKTLPRTQTWPRGPRDQRAGCFCGPDQSGQYCAVFENGNPRAWTVLEEATCDRDCMQFLKYDLKECHKGA